MNLKSVDLNLLVAFDALVTERNVTRAADRLGMTQSALSHALRRLRTMFADPLLTRGPHGMEPTDLALELVQPIRGVLSEVHSIMTTRVAFDPATTTRAFNLSMSDAMSIEVLPEIVRRIRDSAPKVDIVVTTAGPRSTCARIVDDEIDLAVGVFPDQPRDVRSCELYRDTLVCVADRRHPRLRRGRMDEASYLACPHVTVAPNLDSGVQIDDILAALGLERRVMATVSHYIAVPGLVRGTDLVAHTRRGLVGLLRDPADLVAFPIPVPVRVPELSFVQMWHRRHDRDPGHRWLRDLVRSAIVGAGGAAAAARGGPTASVGQEAGGGPSRVTARPARRRV
ncbi:LysR family transcriptional regulator [Rhodoplanes sp. TEM]|uniref:LysR family transcriptional regulator n=1 Tax=Rhodoplanes tepidamans TaxID=200616 RepID=A0ABT5JJV4_RHOTP|nr:MULTISPECIES: LysR family transcriptional regulator [Rhodoplanes]MDC7789872.1 LysR family transcriptional regulator [Rhodoplanes tepidamans]MDC7984863.1 LysR family transcriptional regulator [Rhodoplanes sp. TEM]MDQ0358452.1 DNA-binding transcriptional LysR family regulator [Rhodoplanes tepidamans]